MRRAGVLSLPVNYEIYYGSLSDPNSDLASELAAFGTRPTQRQLDGLAATHFGRASGSELVEEAQAAIGAKLDEILGLLRVERSSLERYGRLLGETSSGLANRQVLSRDFVERVADLMAKATDSTLAQGRQIASSMSEKSDELHEVKAKLEEYRKLAEVDALTQLGNRRAFDRSIARIYDDKRKVMFSALILADIDRFKPVNDRYGHPVGDRILQIVAGLMQSHVRPNIFLARTGGEEFALIVDGATEEAAAKLADDMRQAIERTPFVNVTNGTDYGPITLSFGLCMASEADGPHDLYVKADRALYASKSAGRNRVTRFSSLAQGDFAKNWMLYRRD
jgi:diguanylate cyclase